MNTDSGVIYKDPDLLNDSQKDETDFILYQLPQETQDTLLLSFIVVTFLLVFSTFLLVFLCVTIDIGLCSATEPQ